jgi:hypothetical protein
MNFEFSLKKKNSNQIQTAKSLLFKKMNFEFSLKKKINSNSNGKIIIV